MGLSHLQHEDISQDEEEIDPHASTLRLMSSIRSDILLSACSKNTLLSYDDSSDASQLYMLGHHRDRLYGAAKDLGWAEACNTLGGRGGLNRLRDVLQDSHANISNGFQHPCPQKVSASAATVRRLLTDTGCSCVSSSIVMVISPSHRRHFRPCHYHHCRPRIFRRFYRSFHPLSIIQTLK